MSKYLADKFTNKAGVNYMYFLSHTCMDKDPHAHEDETASDFTAYYSVVTKQVGGGRTPQRQYDWQDYHHPAWP